MEPSNCIARLTSRDVKDARAWADQIAAESRESSRWAPYLADFAALNRAISLLAANARWASAEAFEALMDEFFRHVTDEKPITARQCIQALPEIAAAQPRLIPRIRRTLEHADLSRYRDSMQPLILKDITAVLGQLP